MHLLPTTLQRAGIVNTFSYDLRPVAVSNLPDDKHTAHWKVRGMPRRPLRWVLMEG